jgi:hypothetical protein
MSTRPSGVGRELSCQGVQENYQPRERDNSLGEQQSSMPSPRVPAIPVVLKLAVAALILAVPWLPPALLHDTVSPHDGREGGGPQAWAVYGTIVALIAGAALYDVALGVLVTVLLVALSLGGGAPQTPLQGGRGE